VPASTAGARLGVAEDLLLRAEMKRWTILMFLCGATSWLAGCQELPDPGPETEAIANQAGCDVIGGSCGARGQCCDVHDDCIDRHCGSGFGAVGSCTALQVAQGLCTAECRACHTAVTGCILRCDLVGGAGCGPSACCGDPADPADDTCGEEQACYDRTKMPPELITDPCECEARGIDLGKSPPRPEEHCCDDTGWGCCAAEGAKPGAGGGGCCAPLVVGPDGTCKPPPPTPTPIATSSPMPTVAPTASPSSTPSVPR
jgi:hypothetical protein